MKKNAILLVMFLSIITMIPGLSFAEADKVGLDDVIKILQVLSGGHQPPAFNATGTWAVKSSPNGVTRTGEVFLDMLPDGRVTGYAELTSLSGLSSVTGTVYGHSFDLEMRSDYGAIVVHGEATSDGQHINGTFYNKADVNIIIHWDGYRQESEAQEGTYTYDPENNKLSLAYESGLPQNFDVSDFTETTVTLNGTIWKRNTSGSVGDFVGIWRTDDGSIETIITFDQNGKFSYIYKQLH